MSEDPKYLKQLEEELAGGSLDALLKKTQPPEVPNNLPNPPSASIDTPEIQEAKNVSRRLKHTASNLKRLIEDGTVPSDMTAEELIHFLTDKVNELNKTIPRED